MPNFMLAAAEVVDLESFREVFTSLTGQISVANVVGVIAGIVTVTVGFAFMWWGIRYGTRKIMGSFKNGKV